MGLKILVALAAFRLFPDGQMSLYTYEGYYIFDPSKCERQNKIIPVTVTSFKVDDKDQFFENKIASGEKVNHSRQRQCDFL